MTAREKIVGELLRDLVGTVKGGYDAKEICDEILRHIRESEYEYKQLEKQINIMRDTL